ncbi:hypothetical protein JHK82_042871 [Glycine max]|nr:hypothetical protein JHK85_043517 [Glycine max]KAG5105901.1 hypothetical protein JHK82_042871 [Glycine max]
MKQGVKGGLQDHGVVQCVRMRSCMNWKPAMGIIMMLNCNGAKMRNKNNSSWDGIIQNNNGVFMGGFSCNLGSVSVLHAEIWTMFHGLQLERERGIYNIELQSDSVEAIALMVDD